jgi:hypothetical protein
LFRKKDPIFFLDIASHLLNDIIELSLIERMLSLATTKQLQNNTETKGGGTKQQNQTGLYPTIYRNKNHNLLKQFLEAT